MKPLITLAICTYNRQKFIGTCLQTILEQTLDNKLWELIVVDNNSNDKTAEIVKDFMTSQNKINVHYFFEAQQGLSFARNRCIKEAQGEIVAYIDDDVELEKDYLKIIHQFFNDFPHAIGLGGKTLPKFSESEEPKWLSKYMDGIIGRSDKGNEFKKYTKSMKYPNGCNMTYKKSILIEAGGFNNSLKARADDKYIFNQIKRISSEIYYKPTLFSLHNIDAERLTYSSFKKIYLKSGNEERIRTFDEEGIWGQLKMFLNLALKLVAGLFLFFIYIIKGNYLQGKYIFLSQWFTFLGFIKKSI
ncbi:MAG: glycosyltransferase family 2 protein [Chitinophagaceae bacterium]|nr:glycosyltransferase family 2 protein [Chitinophagaceae bacterium]